jgi:hypothetical protein
MALHNSDHRVRRVSSDARAGAEIPDLHSQLEDLWNAVWAAEKEWRLDDRLSLAVKVHSAPHSRRVLQDPPTD